MASESPGARSGAPRRIKKGSKSTQTAKAHRFEPFSTRISRLKIDPIHRITGDRSVESDEALSRSHFRASLEHWNEFNLSQNYTEFSRKVNLVSESLPQLLHHSDSVLGLLAEYIAKMDELSLEALLDIVAQFARDLGPNFEKYFSQIVTLVISVAATHEAPEVIEWSFTCLTWVFKFLSRLLVPDLRPLLGILLPYLGKSRQKAFVRRFAAESIAFLLRKAAITYPKKQNPLKCAISYLMGELGELNVDRELPSYQAGLMTLFSEAIGGVEGGLHACGPDLLRCLLDYIALHKDSNERYTEVLEGFLVHTIHQSDAEGLQPLVRVVEQYAIGASTAPSVHVLGLSTRLMFVIVATRKGTRIKHWAAVNQALIRLATAGMEFETPGASVSQELLTTIALVMQYAPMSELLPFLDPFTKILTSLANATDFFVFCYLFDSVGQERFQAIFLPHFQHFILSRWKDDQMGLCLLLDVLHKRTTISSKAGSSGYIACPVDWERDILEQCSENHKQADKDFDVRIDAFAKLANCIDFPREKASIVDLRCSLHHSLIQSLGYGPQMSQTRQRFALGRGFQAYVKLTEKLDEGSSLDPLVYSLACTTSGPATTMSTFLRALSEYLDLGSLSINFADAQFDQLRVQLISNLMHTSPNIRTASLKLLQQTTPLSETWAINTIGLLSEIHSTEYSLQNVRRISMFLRKLPRTQEEVSSSPIWSKLVPYFCFGILSQFHGQTAEDLCSAIAEMCDDSATEEIIAEVVDRWLRSSTERDISVPGSDEAGKGPPQLTPFQCSNVLCSRDLSLSATELFRNPTENVQADFEHSHLVETNDRPRAARSLALQVLKAAPAFAEKRSRLITPVFLAFSSRRSSATLALGSGDSASSHTLSPEIPEAAWSYADRKSFLELLGKFMNPRVLYRAKEVHDALLELLKYGKSEIQRLALKALFTWKDPSIRPYEETLLRLLDDKTFRDELAVVFHTDQEESSIEDSHRTELLPVLLRILFGQMVSHSGTHGGQESKRKAILRTLFRLRENEVELFLRVAFGPLAEVHGMEDGTMSNDSASHDLVPLEQQYGLLKTIEAMIETLQSQVSPYGNLTLNPVLYCTIRGCRRTSGSVEQSGSSLARSVRKVGIHCLDMLFQHCESVDWKSTLPLIFDEVVKPRLATFAVETAQGISSLLKLFATWSSSDESLPYLQDYEPSLLDNISKCLTTTSSKDEVKIFVLEQIISNIAKVATGASPAAGKARLILKEHMSTLAQELNILLNGRPGRKVLDAAISVLSNLASLVESSADACILLSSLNLVLCEPAERINPLTRGNLLKSIRSLLSLHQQNVDPQTIHQIYETVVPLFNYFKDNANRTLLAELMHVLASHDQLLSDISKLCTGLNAYSQTRLDEIDFESRLEAFDILGKIDFTSVTATHYQPILYNLIYFLRTAEDLAIRMHAMTALSSFIETSSQTTREDLLDLMMTVLLPALKKGVRDNSETVRQDHVVLFGRAVQYLPESAQLSDMRVLLVGNDDEASFFNNILHIQSLRRGRAMLRLSKEAEKGTLRPSSISTFFLPLLEKFMFDNDGGDAANNLKGQAIVASGVILGWVEWSQFKAIFRRYRTYLESKSAAEKDTIKLLSVAADALVRATKQADSTLIAIDDGELQTPGRPLAKSLPSKEKLAMELSTNFIPVMTAFVHQKDESEMSLRIPVAIIAVKLMKLLPEDQTSQFLPPVLLDLAYILRSRVQDSRDTARRTLSEVATILGPGCVEYVLKELRTSLARGYQLHVLSYTVNSILKAFGSSLANGDLDYCLHSLVSVIMDDNFGAVGQEKDNEDYISQMKEVKSNRSLDSMQMLAATASMRHLIQLVKPLRALLTGTLTTKQSKQVDDLLRMVELGLAVNPSAGSRDLLIFSYEVIQDLYQQRSTPDPRKATNDEINRQRYLVQLSAAAKITRGSQSPLLYKLAKFAIDIVKSTLKIHGDLRTVENMHGFLPIIGDVLMQGQDEVKTSALGLLASIIDLPISDMDQNATLYIIEAVRIIRNSINTNSKISQAALKFITSVLRQRKSTEIRVSDLTYLLTRIAPDLDEPDRRGATLNFIKAVLARRYELPEVYDVVEKIGIMMVSNHDRDARDVARGIWVHFQLQYKQTTSRWTKQIKFLIKNLDYKHPEGRQSVMEAVSTLLAKVAKVDDEKTQELVDAFFMPVILLMSNDDDSNCRELAGALLGHIFQQANREKLNSLLTTLRSWLEQSDNTALTTLGLQTYRIFLDSAGDAAEKDVSFLLRSISNTLRSHHDEGDESAWESIYYALHLFSSLNVMSAAFTMSPAIQGLWSTICEFVSYPHAWVQSAAATLIGAWLTNIARAYSDKSLGDLPLAASHGLLLDAGSMEHVLRSSVRVLRQNWSSPDLSRLTSINLTLLGRFLAANELTIDIRKRSSQVVNIENDATVTESELGSDSDMAEEQPLKPSSSRIPAVQYLLHQLSSILRQEPARLTAGALLPKQSSLQLLRALVPRIPPQTLLPTLNSVLTPLHHLTDTTIPPPKSVSEDFQSTYAALCDSAQELLNEIQAHIGDREYVRARTEVSKEVRERREGRRSKRRIEKVAEPERAARYKKRKGDRKVERKKERAVQWRGKRRGW